ncbi:MAG: hypothetical protein ACRDV9_09305 [Acidimicrobiia bacterium]
MAFREVRVFEVREVLRLWLRGEGFRGVERLSGIDRKTVRRYVMAAVEAGLARDGGEEQLTDEFLAVVVEKVRPHRLDGHGEAWRLLEQHRDQIKEERGVSDPAPHFSSRLVVMRPSSSPPQSAHRSSELGGVAGNQTSWQSTHT